MNEFEVRIHGTKYLYIGQDLFEVKYLEEEPDDWSFDAYKGDLAPAAIQSVFREFLAGGCGCEKSETSPSPTTSPINMAASSVSVVNEVCVADAPLVGGGCAAAPSSVHEMLIRLIELQKQKETQNDIWKDSPYRELVHLQSNNVGNVGEELINSICKAAEIPADCNGAKTKKLGGGEGDGTIMGIPVEIKTAHQGSTSPSFQHELGEVPWKGSRYMIFVDISPDCIYLTIFKNFDEATYKSKEKLYCFPTKTITWRKEKGAFKLDTSVKINEQSVEKGHAIKITPSTPNEEVASFIRKVIV